MLNWLIATYRELALFAGFWLALGLLDDLAVDLLWLRLQLRQRTGLTSPRRLPPQFAQQALRGHFAVLIPAWHEAAVVGTTLRHALGAWPQRDVTVYVGCYPNDPATIAAAMEAAGSDDRVRIVLCAGPGPTTKAGCLNRLYHALERDEALAGRPVRAVVLHDAEDMVHPAELAVFDAALDEADFVQLPVRAEPLASSRWIAGHYLDEFAEAHAKTMVVRDALRAALPGAGVGCAVARPLLAALARTAKPHGSASPPEPFATDCLTEDYELGWQVARAGGRARFLRLRDSTGALVATRAVFPDTLPAAVRQKARWTHGIAYQGWDRLGWSGGLADRWMALRDRRAPLAALVLLAAYGAAILGLVLVAVEDVPETAAQGPGYLLPLIGLVGLGWRGALRSAFTAREYGLAEGLRALARIPLANVIAIAAARRALGAYRRGLGGAPVRWDKTAHRYHPVTGCASASGATATA